MYFLIRSKAFKTFELFDKRRDDTYETSRGTNLFFTMKSFSYVGFKAK